MATRIRSTPAPEIGAVLRFPTKRKRAYASPRIGQCEAVPENVAVLPSGRRLSAADAEAVMNWTASEILLRAMFFAVMTPEQQEAMHDALVRGVLASGGAKVFDDALRVIGR